MHAQPSRIQSANKDTPWLLPDRLAKPEQVASTNSAGTRVVIMNAQGAAKFKHLKTWIPFKTERLS